MLVIAAILAHLLGQVATVMALIACAVPLALGRNPLLVAPLAQAGPWIAGTVDVVGLVDGPMRLDISPDGDLAFNGAGRGVPPALSDGDGGPAFWIVGASALVLGLFTVTPSLPPLRGIALGGLCALAIMLLGYAALQTFDWTP